MNLLLINILDKKIQKKLNLNINDYKEYSQLYTPIEMEINFDNEKFGYFINIPDEDKKYYHIHFDNSKKDIKRNYANYNEKVKVVKIIIDYQVKSFEKLFDGCENIRTINIKKFYRTNITNMSWMFNLCYSLKNINISNFKTNNVTNMRGMFNGCRNLKELNFSNFNTDNVTDMNGMFNGCKNLKELNLSNFNTNNVKDMRYMFC